MKASTWLYVALLLAAMVLFRFLLLHVAHRRLHPTGPDSQNIMMSNAASEAVVPALVLLTVLKSAEVRNDVRQEEQFNVR